MDNLSKSRDLLGVSSIVLAASCVIHNPQILALAAVSSFFGYVAMSLVEFIVGMKEGLSEEPELPLTDFQRRYLEIREQFNEQNKSKSRRV